MPPNEKKPEEIQQIPQNEETIWKEKLSIFWSTLVKNRENFFSITKIPSHFFLRLEMLFKNHLQELIDSKDPNKKIKANGELLVKLQYLSSTLDQLIKSLDNLSQSSTLNPDETYETKDVTLTLKKNLKENQDIIIQNQNIINELIADLKQGSPALTQLIDEEVAYQESSQYSLWEMSELKGEGNLDPDKLYIHNNGKDFSYKVKTSSGDVLHGAIPIKDLKLSLDAGVTLEVLPKDFKTQIFLKIISERDCTPSSTSEEIVESICTMLLENAPSYNVIRSHNVPNTIRTGTSSLYKTLAKGKLIVAIQNRDITTIRLYADKINVHECSSDGATPVYIAAERGYVEAIAVLKSVGADVNKPNNNGATPVYIAAERGHEEAIRALQIAGADMNKPNKNGATPVFIAAEMGHEKAIAALKAAGADVNIPRTDDTTPVYIAAEMGHAGAITALKNAGADMNKANKKGGTPVYIAAEMGHAEAITALKDAGADMNQAKDDGATPVFIAAQLGHEKAIAALNDAGADMNTPRPDGTTPVGIAAHYGHAGAITALKDASADMNKVNKTGATPVYIAAHMGHEKAIAALKDAGADMNQANKDGATPVYIAAERGHAEAIAALVDAGANVNTLLDDITPVYIAAYNGHAGAITALKNADADMNQANKNGATPVYIAAQMGHEKAIAALNDAGADMNTPLPDDTTPVYIAAYNGHARAITALKAAGSDMNKANKNGVTPVFIAAQMGHEEAICALHIAGADMNKPNKNGTAPVLIAAQMGHEEAICALHIAGADMNKANKKGVTPVFIAAQMGHEKAIAALKDAGADVNTPDNNGATPAYIAAEMGHEKAICALQIAGADMNKPNKNGVTPVYIAAQMGHEKAIAALKAAGADVNTPDKNGATPVYIAAQMGHEKAIAALQAAGADMNTPNKNGTAPVYIAAQMGHEKAIAALKAAGADMNKPNKNGATPVYIAAENGHEKAIAALKAAGADMNKPNKNGATPVYIAAKNGHAGAIAALKAAGADVNIPDENGRTPISIAVSVEKININVITALLEVTIIKHIEAALNFAQEKNLTEIVSLLKNHLELRKTSTPLPTVEVNASNINSLGNTRQLNLLPRKKTITPENFVMKWGRDSRLALSQEQKHPRFLKLSQTLYEEKVSLSKTTLLMSVNSRNSLKDYLERYELCELRPPQKLVNAACLAKKYRLFNKLDEILNDKALVTGSLTKIYSPPPISYLIESKRFAELQAYLTANENSLMEKSCTIPNTAKRAASLPPQEEVLVTPLVYAIHILKNVIDKKIQNAMNQIQDLKDEKAAIVREAGLLLVKNREKMVQYDSFYCSLETESIKKQEKTYKERLNQLIAECNEEIAVLERNITQAFEPFLQPYIDIVAEITKRLCEKNATLDQDDRARIEQYLGNERLQKILMGNQVVSDYLFFYLQHSDDDRYLCFSS